MSRKTYKKVITTPELIEEINIKNKKMVDRFLKNFNTKRQDGTIKVYRQNFNIFFVWNLLYNDNKFFVDIRKIEFVDFFDYCVEELKWQPNRYAQMWSSLNSLSTFIENYLDEEYPNYRNNVRKIEKIPKATVRKKTVLTEEQINKLLQHLVDINELQQAFILALACYQGCRKQELFRFNVDTIDVENTAYNDLFIVTTEELKTKGRGKSGKMLYKYILKKPFMPYYTLWTEKRNKIINKTKQESQDLIIDDDGGTIPYSRMDYWAQLWSEYLTEINKNDGNEEEVSVYPHALRHYLCTYLSRIGVEPELIVELFGWASQDMYTIYNDLKAKDKEWKGLHKLAAALEDDDG